MANTIRPVNQAIKNNPEELRVLISNAAYFLSEKRGFEGECQLHDWLEAEEKIHHIYGKS